MGGELRNRFSWSHSRSETFRDCPRRYFYHYYGSWGGWRADADPRARRLYMLKQLKARQMWAGSLVHDTIAQLLGQWRAGRTASPEPGAWAEQAIVRMRREFRQSRDGAYRERPGKALGLIEHHYREPLPDDEWRALAETVRRSLEGFCEHPQAGALRELEPGAWLALEELDTFPVAGVPAYVKLDLGYRSAGGTVRIVDWKTGRRRPRPDGLQLGCYALYAVARWDIAPEEIEVCEVNLNTAEEAAASVSADSLAEARQAIEASIRAMQARLRDVAQNTAEVDDFPAQVEARTCRRCPFREACPEYQQECG